MAQASYIPDATDTDAEALGFFQDVLQAIVTMNSGPAEPGEKYTGMLWQDTSAGYVKRYDGTVWERFVPDFGAMINGGSDTQATTTGTTVGFTGIPDGVTDVDIMLDKVSLSGSDDVLLQLGTNSGFVATGYESHGISLAGGLQTTTDSADGFFIYSSSSDRLLTGPVRLTKWPDSNLWQASGHIRRDFNRASLLTGAIDLSGGLSGIRISSTGTDTFDGGAIAIKYRARGS